MKLNLYKCSTKDREWYSLAKEICKGAIPLQCGYLFWTYDMPPEKIEFVKEVEIDLSSFLEEETEKIKEENRIMKDDLVKRSAELEEYKHIACRLYFR